MRAHTAMTSLGKLAAIGSATVGAAAAASLAWVAVTKGPQKSSTARSASPTPPHVESVIVCAGSDHVLRAVDPTIGCSTGESRVLLTQDDPNEVDPLKVLRQDDDQSTDAPNGSKRTPDAIGALERRLDNLRRSPLFTVVDAHGHPIFAVRPAGVLLYNAAGSPVAAFRATGDGGLFRVISSDGTLAALAGASPSRAGVRITEGDLRRIDMGRQPSGGYALKVLSPGSSEDVLAGVGESKAATGVLAVGDVNGRVHASMTISDFVGKVSVLNEAGFPVAALTQSHGDGDRGGGLLTLTDAAGTPVVKMGVNGRYGAVMTGPGAGFPYVPSSGLPGSYFFGCAGGGACK